MVLVRMELSALHRLGRSSMKPPHAREQNNPGRDRYAVLKTLLAPLRGAGRGRTRLLDLICHVQWSVGLPTGCPTRGPSGWKLRWSCGGGCRFCAPSRPSTSRPGCGCSTWLGGRSRTWSRRSTAHPRGEAARTTGHVGCATRVRGCPRGWRHGSTRTATPCRRRARSLSTDVKSPAPSQMLDAPRNSARNGPGTSRALPRPGTSPVEPRSPRPATARPVPGGRAADRSGWGPSAP